MQKYTLTLRSLGRSKNSVGYVTTITESDPSYLDKVEGLPYGQEAWINHNAPEGIWQIARKKDGVRGTFAGEYESAEHALAALQKLVNSENPMTATRP